MVVSQSERAAVEDKPPPALLLKVINPIVRALLQSRLHRALSRDLMLLHVTGRRSGRIYVIPVGRHQHEGQLVASAGGTWKRNLAGGGDLEVTLDGRRRRAQGKLINDPQEVAQIFSDLLAELGPKRANRLGLRLNVDRAPTVDELRTALKDRQVLRLHLSETVGPVA